MRRNNQAVRVLYSFPHKLGADRICYTAWQQVAGIAAAGADVLVYPGAMHRPLDPSIKVRPTLAWGRVRIPYRVLGRMGACRLHDTIVASRLKRIATEIDLVHAWPLGAIKTLKTAAQLGIPTFLERPNAHTRFAYEVVRKECERLGIPLPPGHEHSYNDEILAKEELEYQAARYLLCPSDFVVRTFIDRGFNPDKLLRHQYGYDHKKFSPDPAASLQGPLKAVFVGGCAPRKGVHFALEAWLKSSASQNGVFQIAGAFVPGYAEKLAPMLAHPSVKVLGHCTTVPELMRQSHILLLPTIEEGSALVTSEARGSGCVLLVSDAAGADCESMKNALVHKAGDVDTLRQHITAVATDRELLQRLRTNSLNTLDRLTWSAAGIRLLEVYKTTIGYESRR